MTYQELTDRAKDCGVFYGLYSEQYFSAVRQMNEYYILNMKLTVWQQVKINFKKYLAKWQTKRKG